MYSDFSLIAKLSTRRKPCDLPLEKSACQGPPHDHEKSYVSCLLQLTHCPFKDTQVSCLAVSSAQMSNVSSLCWVK